MCIHSQPLRRSRHCLSRPEMHSGLFVMQTEVGYTAFEQKQPATKTTFDRLGGQQRQLGDA